jgi:hypothetical protein
MLQCFRNSLKHKSAPLSLSLSLCLSLSLSVAVVTFLLHSMPTTSCNYHTVALFLCSCRYVCVMALYIPNFAVGGCQRSVSRPSRLPSVAVRYDAQVQPGAAVRRVPYTVALSQLHCSFTVRRPGNKDDKALTLLAQSKHFCLYLSL